MLRTERRSLLFRITVAEHCISTMLSIFRSVLIGGPVEYFTAFQNASASAKEDIFLPLLIGVRPFVAAVGLFSF